MLTTLFLGQVSSVFPLKQLILGCHQDLLKLNTSWVAVTNPQFSLSTQLSMAHQQSPHQQRSLGIKSHCTGIRNPDIFMRLPIAQIITEKMQKMSVGNTVT